jgi:hypothetical protein
MTDTQWSEVYSADVEYKAIIVKAILEENEIPAQVVNRRDQAYHFGDVAVFVPAEFTIKALSIIENTPEL